MHMARRAALIPASLLALASFPQPASAGNGTFRNGAFDYCVSVRFNATPAQIQSIQAGFQRGSDVLADATDGQHRFGRVKIVNNSGASQAAEYWVHPSTGRANATVGLYGERGEHVNMYMDSDFLLVNGADGDAYTVAHEHAHHAYGVLDEYHGSNGPAECSDTESGTLSYSIMDNFFVRGGRAGSPRTYTLNEFCVEGNHDPDGDSYQSEYHGEAAWTTIANHPTRSAVPPAAGALPVDAAPPSVPVDFASFGGGLRTVVVVDESGSMSSEQRMEFAKAGARQFVNNTPNLDELGVVGFASTPRVVYSLQAVQGQAQRDAARSAINGLAPTGNTNIGGGLNVALSELQNKGDRSCNEVVVLLSDGDHNTGTAPESVVPSLQQEGVAVITVGVGTGISPNGEASLQSIAGSTGGKYYRVASAVDLVGLLIVLAQESSGSGLLGSAPVSLWPSATVTQSAWVEEGANAATFVVTFAEAASDVEIIAVDPNGVRYTMDDVGTAGQFSRQLSIKDPAPGLWSIELVAAGQDPGPAEFLAFAANDDVSLSVSALDSQVVYPNDVTIVATPRFEGVPVKGASIKGLVDRPNAEAVAIELFDDGSAQSGDAIAGDGVYSGRFGNYSEDGTYTFHVDAKAENTTLISGENLFDDRPAMDREVPSFSRLGSVSIVVTNVPDFIPGSVEIGPETLNLKSRGRWVTAYLELPVELSNRDNLESLEASKVAITAIDGQPTEPIVANPRASSIGDFDNDGILDRSYKFSRSDLFSNLSPGIHEIQIETQLKDRLVIAKRSVLATNPGGVKGPKRKGRKGPRI